MSQKHTYFGYSTPQQRKLLFETWQQTGSVEQACRKARVSQGLFYYWKPRFEAEGYSGLEKFESRVAHKLNYKPEAVQKRVLEMCEQHPEWGKTRISQEMAKANNWVPIVSPNTVRRILKQAGLWPESGAGGKKVTR
jgi:transposase